MAAFRHRVLNTQPNNQCCPLNVWLLSHCRVCNTDKTDFCLPKRSVPPNTHMHAHTHKCVCVQTHMYIQHTQKHTHMHTNIYTNTYANTHTPQASLSTTFQDHEVFNCDNSIRSATRFHKRLTTRTQSGDIPPALKEFFSSLCDIVHSGQRKNCINTHAPNGFLSQIN